MKAKTFRCVKAWLERLLEIKAEGQEKSKLQNLCCNNRLEREPWGKVELSLKKLHENYPHQERGSEADGPRLWEGTLGSEVKALSTERPSEQRGISLSRLRATTVTTALVRSPANACRVPTTTWECYRSAVLSLRVLLSLSVECFLSIKVSAPSRFAQEWPRNVRFLLICVHLLSQHYS